MKKHGITLSLDLTVEGAGEGVDLIFSFSLRVCL